MKRNTLAFAAAVSVLLAGGVAAGQMSAQAQQPAKMLTLSGCVQSGSEAGTFVLQNVTVPAPAGLTGKTNVPKIESSYKLEADTNVDLSKYVSHKVEATGTVRERESGPDGAADGAARSHADLKLFEVRSIKDIAPTCR
jgi:hypothetical protein